MRMDEHDDVAGQRVEQTAVSYAESIARLTRTIGQGGAEGDVDVAVLPPDPVEDVYAQTGGACACHPGFEGTCPVDWCRYHLDSQDRKTWKNMPRRRPDDSDTCSVRLASQGGRTLEEVAVLLGLTRERVRQIEEKGMAKMTRGFIRLELMGRGELSPDLHHRLRISRVDPACGTCGGETR